MPDIIILDNTIQISSKRKMRSFGLQLVRCLHIQKVCSGSSSPAGLLFHSTKLNIFLRLVRSPSHMLFLASNIAILVHLQYICTTKTSIISAGDKKKLARLREQIKEIEDLEEEEKRVREQIRVLKSEPCHRDGKANPTSGTRAQVNNKNVLRSVENRDFAQRFCRQRAEVYKSVSPESTTNVFSCQSIMNSWYNIFEWNTPPSHDWSHQNFQTGKRNRRQLIIHCLLGDVISGLKSRTFSENGMTFGDLCFGGREFKSVFHESNSGHHLTYEKSDSSKLIRSSKMNSDCTNSNEKEVSTLSDLQLAFAKYVKSKDPNAYPILLLDLVRHLMKTNADLSDEVLSFIYHNFGLLKLRKYQALLLIAFPDFDRFSRSRAFYIDRMLLEQEKVSYDRQRSFELEKRGKNSLTKLNTNLDEESQSERYRYMESLQELFKRLLASSRLGEAEYVFARLLVLAMNFAGNCDKYEPSKPIFTKKECDAIPLSLLVKSLLRSLDAYPTFALSFTWFRDHSGTTTESKPLLFLTTKSPSLKSKNPKPRPSGRHPQLPAVDDAVHYLALSNVKVLTLRAF